MDLRSSCDMKPSGVWMTLVLGAVLWGIGGCAVDEPVDDAEGFVNPEVTYGGLTGQKCAVLVWADSFTRAEFNQIQIDLARVLQSQIVGSRSSEEASAKRGASMPQFVDPRSVVLYQRQHPEIDSLTVGEVAPHLGVPRVVHVEIEYFQTQSPRSILLLKGAARATLRVAEVTDGRAVVVFEEKGVTAAYPPLAREGVVPTDKVNERTVYEGVLVELGKRLAARLPVAK